MKTISTFIAIFIIGCTLTMRSQSFRWATHAGGPGEDLVRHSVTDSAGNTFVIGIFEDSLDFDPGPGTTMLVSRGGFDIFLAAYSPLGTLVYAKQIGGTGEDEARKIHFDKKGHIYFCGAFTDSVDMDASAAEFKLGAGANKDGFVCKYTVLGNFVWAKQIVGGDAEVMDVTALLGRCYITGNFWNQVDLDPSSATDNFTSNGLRDLFICCLDESGNRIWTRTMGSSGMDGANCIDGSITGDIFIAGTFADRMDFDPGSGVDEWYPPGGGQYDIFLLRLWGDDGNSPRHGMIGGPQNEQVNDLSVRGLNEVWFTGHFSGKVNFNPRQGVAIERTSVGGEDAFYQLTDGLLTYQGGGVISGPANEDGRAISFGSDGRVLVTGIFEQTTDFDPGEYELLQTSKGSADIFLLQLRHWGGLICVSTMGGPGADGGSGVGADALGNIFLTGSYGGYNTTDVDFDPGAGVEELPANGTYQVFAASYEPCAIATGISENSSDKFLILPNPASDQIIIRGLTEPGMIKIYDSKGVLILTQNVRAGGSIDIRDIPSGLYYLKVENSHEVFKLVKVI